MPRFVILQHDWPQLHWDLMLENGANLRTWRLPELPQPHHPIPLVALPPHRSIYLDYEGPVSGNRGSVVRVLSGTYRTLLDTPGESRFEFELGEETWAGTITGEAAGPTPAPQPEPPGHLLWQRVFPPSTPRPA